MAIPLRIKICGVTTEADAAQAAALGADAIGLNFYARSPRCVDPQTAHFILRVLPPFVDPVAVFTNTRLRQVFEAVNQLGGVRTIQWHGERRELSDTFPFRLVSAFPVSEERNLVEITHYLQTCRSSGQMPVAILVDGHAAGKYGGTGVPAPWKLLADFRPEAPMILAGGLTPENVAEAVRIVRPYAVDVASGVESSPGQKDPEKIRRFIGNALEAAARA
jgi:phosphoribosylanthranilate isomerase